MANDSKLEKGGRACPTTTKKESALTYRGMSRKCDDTPAVAGLHQINNPLERPAISFAAGDFDDAQRPLALTRDIFAPSGDVSLSNIVGLVQ